MSIILALALAASTRQPLISNWADCMTAYARPRLSSETVDKLVDDGLASCQTEADAVRRSYISDLGPERGADAFNELSYAVRAIMMKRVREAKEIKAKVP